MERNAHLVLAVVLLLMVLGAAVLTTVVTLTHAAPALLFVIPLLLAPVAAATLEVGGRPAHFLGLVAIGPVLIVTVLGFSTSPTPDARWLIALVQWLLVATLWGTLAFLLRPAPAAAVDSPETPL